MRLLFLRRLIWFCMEWIREEKDAFREISQNALAIFLNEEKKWQKTPPQKKHSSQGRRKGMAQTEGAMRESGTEPRSVGMSSEADVTVAEAVSPFSS
jgi:hypothetical protein